MKRIYLALTALALALSMNAFSQTNVYDHIIATSPNHTSLKAAIIAAGLEGALQNPAATLTVFAPDNDAFDDLAASLNTTVPALLALPNLADILTYHVLGTTVGSSAVTNGLIAQPLSTTNTLKLTLTGSGDVYVNQAKVTTADLTADNGVVHSLDAVLLPAETVADIAIDNGFSSLVAAVVKAELLPALTNPFATFTFFAPNNQAFADAATALGTDINGLLALPNLKDILLYHVLGAEVASTAVTNGQIVAPLSTTNTLKLTVTALGKVFVNQAEVTTFDITSDNGTVHVLKAIVLPIETPVDVAIDNGFSSLVAAVVKAELLPALTNPFTQLTVFAPTNQAFDDLATALGTDLNGVLASPELTNILLYHVLAGKVLSTDLTNGMVPTLNGQSITVDLASGVKINSSNVTTADLVVGNGVVHVIDAVLLPLIADVKSLEQSSVLVYPNPTSSVLKIEVEQGFVSEYQITDIMGRIMLTETIANQANLETDISTLPAGEYFITLKGNNTVNTIKFSKN